MVTMKVFVPQPVFDPVVAAKAGINRRLPAGFLEIPRHPEYIRLLKKGHLEPACPLSAKYAGRPAKSETQEQPKAEKPAKSSSR